MSRRSNGRARAAFTLMEVLLVLVILVVLGSLAVGMFTGAKRTADRNAAQVQVDAIDEQCQRYNLEMSQFPPSFDALFNNPNNSPNWSGPYLTREIPNDPWGNPYQYIVPGQRHPDRADIWSWGPDGANGTQDDIYNR